MQDLLPQAARVGNYLKAAGAALALLERALNG